MNDKDFARLLNSPARFKKLFEDGVGIRGRPELTVQALAHQMLFAALTRDIRVSDPFRLDEALAAR